MYNLKIKKGFTLIELLVVVVIIGILAAIAIPRFSRVKDKAYYTTMASDLKNLVPQQELVKDSAGTYAGSLAYSSAVNDSAVGSATVHLKDFFQPSTNDIVSVGHVNASGWMAAARHLSIDTTGGNRGRCIIVGTATGMTREGRGAPGACTNTGDSVATADTTKL